MACARERASVRALIGAAPMTCGLGDRFPRGNGPVASASHSASNLLPSGRALGVLSRRRTGLPLRATWKLRAGGGGRRGTFGRRHSATGKANALSPLVAVVKTVCHSNRLASCITRLSYRKDVQQMGACAKSSVNGTNGDELGTKKQHPTRAIESCHQNGSSQRAVPLAVRPKNGAAHFSVLPSVEL